MLYLKFRAHEYNYRSSIYRVRFGTPKIRFVFSDLQWKTSFCRGNVLFTVHVAQHLNFASVYTIIDWEITI